MSNYSLLTVAAESSDSDALELLLNAPSHNNHQKRWSLDDIQNAIFTIPTQHGPQRRKCLNLLSDATFDTMRHTAPPASTVLIVFTSLFMERLLSYVY